MKKLTLLQLLPKEELDSLSLKVPNYHLGLWHYWEKFVEGYLSEGRSEVQVRNVRDVLRMVMRKLNLYSIEQCNNKKIIYDVFHAAKEEFGWSNATLNTYINKLVTYFRWLEDMGYVDSNEVSKVRKCKEEINEQYTLNDEQVNLTKLHIFKRRQTQLERWRNHLFLELMTFTGARPCEILGIQCRDISLQENVGKCRTGTRLVIRGKKQKGRPRYYWLPSRIRDALQMYIKIRQDFGREEANLFVSSSKRTGWTDKGMRALFKRLSKELGFKVTAYSIRRYVASKLNGAGMGLEDIANYLGHTRISTTKRYIERSCALTDKCAEVMGGG